MGSVNMIEPPPQKRRKGQKISNAAPKWETTRAFAEPKSQSTALPTIAQDGAIHRPSAKTPKFTASKKIAKAASAEIEHSESQTQNQSSTTRDAKEAKEKPSTSFKAARKRQRRELEAYAKKIDDFEATKANIANIATKLVANPNERVSLFKQLRQMAQHHKGKSAALVIMTEAQLYKDIAPAYKIRSISEREAQAKVSKDVARIRNFEEAFLANYQRFVKSCVSISRWRPGGAKETVATKNMATVRLASCKALGELIGALPHFNEANIVANIVCGLVTDRDGQIRAHSANSLKVVLQRAHRASGQTLEICVLIAKALATSAAGKQRNAPEEVLDPLVSIQFANFPLLPKSSKKPNEPKKSKRFNKKRRRKGQEEADEIETELERDLREADAEASPQELYAARKSLLDAACHAYFNVIKAATTNEEDSNPAQRRNRRRIKKPPPALSGALKGLMRVSTFVNTNILEAILGALTPLIEEGALPLGVRFRCLSAAYAILAKNSTTSSSNPDSFTGDVRALDTALYTALGCLYTPEYPAKDDEYLTFDIAETMMAAKLRRNIPTARCAALARRLAILATSAAPTHACSIGLLLAAQQLMSPMLVSSIYLQEAKGKEDFGGDLATVQTFDMEVDDPDTANAERSASWELACMAFHFHPSTRDIAQQIATGSCGLQMPNTKETIVMRAKKHSSAEGGFSPAPATSLATGKLPKRPQRGNLLHDRVLKELLPEASERKVFLTASMEQVPIMNLCWD